MIEFCVKFIYFYLAFSCRLKNKFLFHLAENEIIVMSSLHNPGPTQAIPGLLQIPDEVSAFNLEDIQLTSFDLKPFTVPGAHRFGKCRPVTDFDRICVLGEGAYGTVYKVKDKISKEIHALKKLKIAKETEMLPQNFLREITNLKSLKHENIVNLLGIAVGKSIESTYLILEYCEYTLSAVIDEVNARLLGQPQIKNIMKQLFTGLDFIHKNCILHRDISPPNILFTETGILKITDFGSSRKTPRENITPNVGLRWYKAPEILFGSNEYTCAVDIWACGCIFGELMHKKAMFRGESDADVIRLIIEYIGTPTETSWPGFSELPVPKNYELIFQPYNRLRSTFDTESSATVSLMVKTLLYNPSARPSAEVCLQHAYFDENPLACSFSDLLITLMASKAIERFK